MTPVAWAAYHGHARHVRMLLRRGADPSLASEVSKQPLFFAACREEPGCLNELFAAQPSLALVTDELGRSPLHVACTHGSVEVVVRIWYILNKLGVSGVPVDHRGRTPLHCAAVVAKERTVAALLELGHPPDVVDAAGHMPVWYARIQGHLETVRMLREYMVQYHRERQREEGGSLFSLASEGGGGPSPPAPTADA